LCFDVVAIIKNKERWKTQVMRADRAKKG
jgi:hypothetical protein